MAALVASLAFLEPPLQFHARNPIFLLDGGFFTEHLAYPGGLVGYLAAFLQQFFMPAWFGALISVSLAGAISLLTKRLWERIRQAPVVLAHGWPVLLLLLVQLHYQYPWMELTLGLLIVLIAVSIYYRGRQWPVWSRIGLFLVLGWTVYYVAGGVFLVFALMSGLFELFNPTSWTLRLGLGLGYWIWGGCLPWLACRRLFAVPPLDAFFLWLPSPILDNRSWPALALVLSIPLLTAAFLWLGPKRNFLSRRFPGTTQLWRERPWLGAAAFLVLGTGLFAGLTDRQAKLRLRVDYYSTLRQWDQVLRWGSQVKNPEPAVISDINRALYHTGRLSEDLFHYPQKLGWKLWLYIHDTMDASRTLKASDLLFELGQINRAERMAGEDLELNGYHPAVLKRLALVNILKGEPAAARLFFHQLAKSITHRAWALERLRQMDADPTLAREEELRLARPLMLRKDYVGEYDAEALLYQLLLQNRQNRMAYEYLMAHYLLEGQMENVVKYLAGLKDFGRKEIPRPYEEAILMYQFLNKNQTVNLQGYSIRPQTTEAFQRFNQVVKRHAGNMDRARHELQSQFGDTFWFYYLYYASASMLSYVTPATPP